MSSRTITATTTTDVSLEITASSAPRSEKTMAIPSDWQECQDTEYGFVLRVPPDWRSTTEQGRCVQIQKGESALPNGVPDVDVSIHVTTVRGNFPADYPNSSGVKYSERRQLRVNGLSAVRARFQSSGPVPNEGIEYAVRKGDNVLSIYISQPKPNVEKLFDEVVKTLRW